MPFFDRFDICEAYACLEWDYNRDGILRERGRPYSIGVQLARMQFRPAPNTCTDTLTENGREIYDAAVEKYKLPKGDS